MGQNGGIELNSIESNRIESDQSEMNFGVKK